MLFKHTVFPQHNPPAKTKYLRRLGTLNSASNLVLFSRPLIPLEMIVLIVICIFKAGTGKRVGVRGGVGVCSRKRQYN